MASLDFNNLVDEYFLSSSNVWKQEKILDKEFAVFECVQMQQYKPELPKYSTLLLKKNIKFLHKLQHTLGKSDRALLL